MSIKLKGTTTGSAVILAAPADTSPTGTEKTLTLPTTEGSANQLVKNGGTAGELEFSSMVEDSSGRLMLGTTSPGPTGAEQLTIADTANAGITIRSGDNAGGAILFEDSQQDRGEIQYSHNGDYMRFKTAGTERLRLDDDGHLQIRREGIASMPNVDTRHTRYVIRQTNGQEAILGSVYAQGKTAWGGDLAFASKQASGNPSSGLTERMRLHANGELVIYNQPSFQAVRSGNYTQSGSDDFVPYNSTIHNRGGHYNTSTYRFTAPVAGHYLFFANVYRQSGTFGSHHIRKNNTNHYSFTEYTAYNNNSHHYGIAIVDMGVNDYVHIRAGAYKVDGNSFFGGYLLG